jgi:hypothetical protein
MRTLFIFSYTRAQAIEDGVLVDVSKMAREAGFLYPVALTRAVWERYVRVPEGLAGQDEPGRLWDILWMLSLEVRRSKKPRSEVRFRLFVQTEPGERPELVTLKALCGPGDAAEPVMTILLPHED